MMVIVLIISILTFITIFIVMLFIWSKFARFFKKKSHQYIVPPIPGKDRNWNPVDFSKYNCFIFIKDSSEDFLLNKLSEVLNSNNESNPIEKKQIEIYKDNNWIILKIIESSFAEFKSLVWCLDEYSENLKHPQQLIGFCQHKSIPLQDYVFKVDRVLKEEDFIGSFRTGKNFGIHLPYAGIEKSGNISLSRNQEIDFYSEVTNLPLEVMDKKMIPYEEVEEYHRQSSSKPIQ